MPQPTENHISLLIPTKDRPDNVERLLGSLQEHGYINRPNFRPVVVDSSKSKDTKSVALMNGADHIDAQGLGKSAAMNYAIDHLTSEFIGFVDDDILIVSDTWLDMLMRNFTAEDIGYVSGRVVAASDATEAQRSWEAKGALNKGPRRIEVGREFFHKWRFHGVPVQLFTMGANHIMRKAALDEIGAHDERFGPGQSIPGAGADLDLSYKLLQHGFRGIYDPEAVAAHVHPESFEELREKMYQYGISDTAIHAKFFAEFGDVRSFFQLFFRTGQNMNRLRKSLIGRYPLPANVLLQSIRGNIVGPLWYLRHRHEPSRVDYKNGKKIGNRTGN